MLRGDVLATGVGFAAFEAGVAYGGNLSYTGSGVPSEATLIPTIVVIIGGVLAIMYKFAHSTHMAEEYRRRGEGAKSWKRW